MTLSGKDNPLIERKKPKMPLGLKIMIIFFILVLGAFATVLVVGLKQAQETKQQGLDQEIRGLVEAEERIDRRDRFNR